MYSALNLKPSVSTLAEPPRWLATEKESTPVRRKHDGNYFRRFQMNLNVGDILLARYDMLVVAMSIRRPPILKVTTSTLRPCDPVNL